MDFEDTPVERSWRSEVRAFIAAHVHQMPRGMARYNAIDAAELLPRKAWQQLLYDAGYIGLGWPVEFGGRSGTPMQAAIVGQELERVGSAPLVNRIGLGMAGPTILAHGTRWQKARYIRPLLRCDEVWCQLFSEPAAGSDLAAVATRAVCSPDGRAWRITGQKVWTSTAHHADFGILIARTDPSLPKHRGLTFFIVDMHEAGISVRPLRQMSGDTGFNEVFFDDVPVAGDAVVGSVDDGWRVVLTTLMNERLAIGGGGSEVGIGIEDLLRLCRSELASLPHDKSALMRQEIGHAWIEALAVRLTGYRRLTAISRGERPGPEASAGKLAAVNSARRIADIGWRLLGDKGVWQQTPDGTPSWPEVAAILEGLSIGGGTEQILKNVVGERVLGLSPDLRADKTVAFNQRWAAEEADQAPA